jgi:aminoglycoside 3-N-acetyltransferase
MHSIESLADDFRTVKIRPSDTVMLHASVRAVGEMAGGPDAIHLALKAALTDTGTLMMYASCPRYYDEIGRGTLPAATELELREKLPAFDSLLARADRENGALVEMFRTYPGSRVNAHVARFVCWGAQSDYLISSQPWNFPFGQGSALERFLILGGKIVLLGSDHDAVTFLHHVEHVADFPGKRIACFEVPVLEDGQRVWRTMKEIDTSSEGAHQNWPDSFFRSIVDAYLEESGNGGGLVGDAETFVIEARPLFDFAAKVMIANATRPTL